MESIEAFMAERIVRPLIIGSVNDLRFSHRLVDIDLIPRTADSLVGGVPGTCDLSLTAQAAGRIWKLLRAGVSLGMPIRPGLRQ